MDFKAEIAKELSKLSGKEISEDILEMPPDSKLGDYAFPCFTLAKDMKKSPIEIAKDFAGKFRCKGVSEVKVVGPYINFFMKKDELSKVVLTKIFNEKQDYGKSDDGHTILIESPSPNTNKPLHLGHVRNMLLGNTLTSLFRHLGYKSLRVDVVNDRGVHICKSMLAYQKYGNNKQPDKKSDHFVGEYYVKYSQMEKENPAVSEEIQDMLRKWEDKDADVRTLWKTMNMWARRGFDVTYKRYGVEMDKAYYESDIYEQGRDMVLAAFKKGLFQKDDNGNLYLEDDDLGKKIVLRADGTTIYMTQDIALAKLRYDDYKMDKMVYVVGSEQLHHFKVLFKIFDLLGYKFAKDCYHLAYGMIYLPEGKMKSREGTVVDADNLAEDMHETAKKELLSRYPDLSVEELEKRSEEIGMGAIKFFILKYDPMKDFVFNPKDSISFEGETGPYVQYTHARCASILRKFDNEIKANIDFSKLQNDEDKAIILHLETFSAILEKSAEFYKPSLITRYLLDLCQLFNEYYHKYQILSEDKELEHARVLLVYCVKEVLAVGLGLLGIAAPDVM
ncbi:MAG: arginine--tRNA ligase [archaeon]